MNDMPANKDHWYDGWFYDHFIAPNQDSLFDRVKSLIGQDASVLDVGCGTGRLAFALADRCKSVVGLDLSIRNIDRASKNLKRNPNPVISFIHGTVEELKNSGKEARFDYAVLTYVIHEVDEEKRIRLLEEIAGVAERIIVGDYQVPQPPGLGKVFTRTIEFLAGTSHYRNFKSYLALGGIEYLAAKAGLKVVVETLHQQEYSHLVVLSR